MSINYTAGAPQSGGIDPILEKGRYAFRTVGAEQKKSNAGNPMIEFKARHIKEDGTEGRAVYGNLVFTDKAFWKIDQFLAACGKHPGEGNPIEIDTDDMIGWEFEADVEITQDNKDRDRNEFANFIIAEEEAF